MAELSAKEYWLLKEIEEEFRESVNPLLLLRYMKNKLLWSEMTESIWVDIKDLIEFDNVVHKQSHWLSALSIL